MLCLLWILVLIAAVWTLAYRRVPLWVCTGAAAFFLLFITKSGYSPVISVLLWLVFLPCAILFNFPALRCRLLTSRLLELYRKVMPSISPTEQEALDAGTVWWDGELFSGCPDWKKLLSLPVPRLSAEEQEFLDGPVEKLCSMLDEWRITNELNDLPEEVWRYLKENRFFGMIIPKKYDGLEFSAYAHSNVVMKIASRSVAAAVTVMVPNSLGPAELLLHYGTDEQKNYYLPRLARGEEIPCFALTNPEAGSDAGAMPDMGVVCHSEFQGKKDVLGIRLNWEKRYITLGPVATLLGLAFKLYDPEHLLGDRENLGITLAMIPADTPNIIIGKRHDPLNIPFQVGPNSGKDVFIPIDWIIGGPTYAGQGWRMLMNCLAAGRSISLPALSTGSSKMAGRATGAYARIRKQFKMPIGRFEGVKEALARIAGNTYVIDAARIMTAGGVDQGEKPSVVSAIVKYHLTERNRKVINDAMDVHGGSAICMGPRNFLGRVYQSLPIGITVEGANILTRSMIIFGQGAIRCHPYITKEIRAAADPDAAEGLKKFDRALFGHIGFAIGNFARSLFLGITNARFVKPPVVGPAGCYYQHLTRMSAAFALVSDVSMLLLGGALKRKESLSARLSDILSHLYLASAALKHFEDQGRNQGDLPLLEWACQDALFTIQERFYGVLENFPNFYIGKMLRFLVFPIGKAYTPPDDKLSHNVADLLLTPSTARDRLTAGMYMPDDSGDPLNRIEEALKKVITAEAVEKKLREAVRNGVLNSYVTDQDILEAVQQKVINEHEASILRDADEAMKEVIKVDDF